MHYHDNRNEIGTVNKCNNIDRNVPVSYIFFFSHHHVHQIKYEMLIVQLNVVPINNKIVHKRNKTHFNKVGNFHKVSQNMD